MSAHVTALKPRDPLVAAAREKLLAGESLSQPEGQSYPIRSGLARLLAGGGSLAVSSPSPVRRHASNGQSHVPLATWQIEHSSQQATSADLRLNALIVRAARSSAGGAPPWARWRVYANNLAVAVHAAAPCPVEVKRAMIDWWGPIVTEYYSGTEAVGRTSR